MSRKVHCVECGDRIKGNIVMLNQESHLVTAGICEEGPHCEGCHATACEEFKDTKELMESFREGRQ